jgi:hypothetical protein
VEHVVQPAIRELAFEDTWIVRVPLASSQSFNTSRSVRRFPSDEAQAGRWQPLNPLARSCWT